MSISTEGAVPEPGEAPPSARGPAPGGAGSARGLLSWLAVVGLALPAGAVLLVMAVARRPVVPPGVVAALPRLEAEVEAAKGTGLLLVLDPEGHALAVRARGRTLDTAPLLDVRVELHRPAEEARAGSALGLWTVEVEPEGGYRRVIAPPALRPYEEGEEEEAEAPATNAPPEVLPDPPASYTVGLDSGWELVVAQELPPDGAWSRFRQALAEGWARQWRRPLKRPDRLLLLTTAEQGSRLHHLFRKGTPIVLAREPMAAPPAPAPAEPVSPAEPRGDKDAPVGS